MIAMNGSQAATVAAIIGENPGALITLTALSLDCQVAREDRRVATWAGMSVQVIGKTGNDRAEIIVDLLGDTHES